MGYPPYMGLGVISRFVWRVRRTWGIVRLYWGTEDCDWSTIALLMRHQIRRTREHIVRHDFITDAPVIARQMRIAETLLSRMLDEPYYEIADTRYPARGKHWGRMISDLGRQDEQMLGRIIGKCLRRWWD